jgi:membrane protein
MARMVLPSSFARPLARWLAFVRDCALAAREHRLTLIAAAVAFYSFLSIFPGLAAIVAIYGLLFDDVAIDDQMHALANVVPPEALRVLRTALQRSADGSRDSLNTALFLGTAAALLSAQRGTAALCQALSIVCGAKERRRFIERTVVSLVLTVGAVLVLVVTLCVVARLPALLAHIAPATTVVRWLSAVAWPLLAAAMLFSLAIVYRWGPQRPQTGWRWVSWGSLLATSLWLAGSWGFSFYLGHFGSFDRTYGSMAAIAILLTWIYLTALVVLLGAEVDSLKQTPSAAATAGPTAGKRPGG